MLAAQKTNYRLCCEHRGEYAAHRNVVKQESTSSFPAISTFYNSYSVMIFERSSNFVNANLKVKGNETPSVALNIEHV